MAMLNFEHIVTWFRKMQKTGIICHKVEQCGTWFTPLLKTVECFECTENSLNSPDISGVFT